MSRACDNGICSGHLAFLGKGEGILTAKEAITRARSFRANAAADDVMLSWLSELEGRIQTEIFLLDVHDIVPVTDADAVLFAKYPHDGIYVSYLIMQTDAYQKEYESYSASKLRFDTEYEAFARYMAENHMPANANKARGRGGDEVSGACMGALQPFWSSATAYIGVNGNWWYGGLDTGIKGIGADGVDGEAAEVTFENVEGGVRVVLKDRAHGENAFVIFNGRDGLDGEDGADGLTPYIGANGDFWIGNVDTGVKAQGEHGADGVSPSIGANGHWYIGEIDTGVRAQGERGADGADGLTPYIGASGNWYIGEIDTGVKAQGADGADGVTKVVNVPYAASVTVEPNNITEISVLSGACSVTLGDGPFGLDNEWAFLITQGDVAYDVVLPEVVWQMGMAPSFAENTSTEVRLYLRGGVLKGVWDA